MSSQKAKELRALALSLSLVNDDLKQKRYLRKSEFYKESDRYKMERRAQQLAAVNLSNELKSVAPAVAGVLINAVNNAPPEVVGHAGDEEIKEGDFKNTSVVADNIVDLIGQSKSLTEAGIQEAIKNLQKIPDERAAAKREKGISDDIFSELIDKKIDSIITSPQNAVNISNEELNKMNEMQTLRLLELYKMQEDSLDDIALTNEAEKAIERHMKVLTKRMKVFNKQKELEAELKTRAKPTKPKLKREPTPPVGPPPPSIVAKRGRGRPKSKEVEERKQMAKEDKPPKPRGRPRKKEAIVTQSQADKKIEEMLKARQKSLQPMTKAQAQELMKPSAQEKPRILNVGTSASAVAAGTKSTTLEGDGLKDYLAYMKGRKPTKKMKKLILLIGSKRAGNNSYKLNVEIEKLMHDIKHDLEDKIRKHKSKSVRKQASAVAMEKKKLLIREAAKKQMQYEKSLSQY